MSYLSGLDLNIRVYCMQRDSSFINTFPDVNIPWQHWVILRVKSY